MQILLTEAEYDKLKSAAEGGEIRAQEIFKTAMKVYSGEFSRALELDQLPTGYCFEPRIGIYKILSAHKSARAAAEQTLVPEPTV